MRASELLMCLKAGVFVGANTNARVLMVGPDRSLQGGIVSVVDGYFEAGLAQRCAAFEYCGTGVGGNLITKSFAFARSLFIYRKLLDDFDIVHLHVSSKGSYKRKALMAKIARKKGKKVILHEHSGEFARDFDAGSEEYRADVRRTFGAADRVIVLSEEWRDYFTNNVCAQENLVVLHNSVFVPDEACQPTSRNVLFLGRLNGRKSPDVLLRSAKTLVDSFPDARFVFAGDGYIDRYRELAVELGVDDKCDFFGWVSGEDKERLFSQAGIFCLPSKNEGMPMSLLEAMAHGIPSVCTKVGGVPQVIDDGDNGLLIAVDDVDGLTAALHSLLESEKMRLSMGGMARVTIQDRFGIEASLDLLIDVYNDLYSRS